MNLLQAYSDGNIGIGEAFGVSLKGIAVVMIILAFLALFVMLLSKVIRLFEREKTDKNVNNTENTPTSVSSESEGELRLYKTDEKTAAVIMAIVSKESKIPLNRLKFNSIKLIEKEEKSL